MSPILGNAGPRITSSMGNIVGGGNIGRSMSSGGGLSVPGLASRLNMSAYSASGNLSVQGPNRLMSGVLQQGILPLICDKMFGLRECCFVTDYYIQLGCCIPHYLRSVWKSFYVYWTSF